MSGWVLTAQLQAFRRQMDAVFPDRDRRSDGTVGDVAHQAETSGHNPDRSANAEYEDGDARDEVRAIDVDADTGNPDVSMEDVVQHLVRLARSGKLAFIRYMIFDQRMWSASTGWQQRAYTGRSPHTEHLHLSGAYTQAADEDTDADYHLEDLVALTEDQTRAVVYDALTTFFAITDQPDAGGKTSRIGRDALSQGVPNPIRGGKTPVWQLLGDVAVAVGRVDEEVAARLAPALAAALPVGVQVSEAQLQAAIVGALRELAAPDV